jgi:hypothetical protein
VLFEAVGNCARSELESEMLSIVTQDNDSGRWLDFAPGKVASVGVQIPPGANPDIPFNIFWWGIANSDNLKKITLQLVHEDQEIEMRGGVIRSICYGPDWKEVFVSVLGVEPKVRAGTLSLRFEYVPSYASMTEARGKIMTWARFNSYPDPQNEDAPESVGILLPYRIFSRVEMNIVEFIKSTSTRPLDQSDFQQISKRIGTEFSTS